MTFCYTGDNANTAQFGLIAEDVAEVNPELTVRDKTGELLTVRYDAVNMMLLNEFLKEHRRVEELEAKVVQQRMDFQMAIAKLKQTVASQLLEQASQIQKVSAKVKAARPATQMFVENP